MYKRGNLKTLLGFAVLIAIVLALVFFYDKSNRRPERAAPNGEVAVETTGEVSAVSRILIGVPKPLETQDAAYLYDEVSNELTRIEQPAGWRAGGADDEIRPEFRAVENDPDATRLVLGDMWSVVLRDAGGSAYQNPVWVGLVDEATAAVQADRDERLLLFIRTNGTITEAFTFSELYKIHGVYGNAVWVTTALPGEGLEAEPQGPAEVIRVDGGGYQTLATENMAIDSLTAHDSGAFAYRFIDGSYKARKGGFLWEGSGRPLFWLNDHELLVAQGEVIKRVDLTASSQVEIGEVDGMATSAKRQLFIEPK
jgi:hypothetical protein